MKGKKQFLTGIASMCMALAIAMCISTNVEAANAPKKVKISPKIEYTYSDVGSDVGAIWVKLDTATDYIANVKSGNVALVVKMTSAEFDYEKENNVVSKNKNEITLGLYAKKALKTNVTFDVFSREGVKKETITVAVEAKNSQYTSPVKKITFRGKDMSVMRGLTKSNKGRLKVKMNKNFKLTKIEIGTYTKPTQKSGWSNEMKYKKVRNNANISVGKYSYQYCFQSTYSGYTRVTSDVTAPTYIKISYKNTKTGDTGTIAYTLKRLAVNK